MLRRWCPGSRRALGLYDNAGEHFLPGRDTLGSPVTRHLARSRVLFFLFDPTQDPRFRKACSGKMHDPQMAEGLLSALGMFRSYFLNLRFDAPPHGPIFDMTILA